jgi:hypothetical protein
MTLILQEHNWASKRLGCKCYLKLSLELSRDNHVKNYAKSLIHKFFEIAIIPIIGITVIIIIII